MCCGMIYCLQLECEYSCRPSWFIALYPDIMCEYSNTKAINGIIK